MFRNTIARIKLDAVKANLKNARKCLPRRTKLMAVVKADAYGHGSAEVAGAVSEAGADYLAVAMAEEGLKLRQAGIELPILILGISNNEQMELAIDNNLDMCIACTDDFIRLEHIASKKGRTAFIHIKIDTGMGRIGFRSGGELINIINLLNQSSFIKLIGMFSHFACADESDEKFTCNQKSLFDYYAGIMHNYGYYPLLHIANSAAIIRNGGFDYDMARLGISLYGYYPSDYIDSGHIELQHAMSLHSKIVFVKTIGHGDSVSYGATYISEGSCKIATVPIGYGDGYSRLLSNRGSMIVVSGGRGYMCHITGRICMDQTMIDVTSVPSVSVGDDVILLGSYGELSIDADDMARLCNTISYEILLGFNSRIPRVYD